jgi:hypothetical protein
MSFLGETLQAGVHCPEEFLKRLPLVGTATYIARSTSERPADNQLAYIVHKNS